MAQTPILSVRDLNVKFSLRGKTLHAIRDVSLDLYPGETLAIVGESGSGKSVLTKTFMGLMDANGWIDSGSILYNGQDLAQFKTEKEWLTIRGKEIAMVLQDPMTSLNPLKTIGAQIEEALIINERIDKKTASEKTVELLRMVGVPDPARCANSYPHQLSGGMRQRAMIAMAFSCEPKLLLADEPTTALDVTIQAQILDLIQTLKEQHGMTVVFVTHDLGIVADIAQRVIVMYAGRVVEDASCSELFRNPLHPYTRGLLNCIPRIDDDREELDTIEGQVPTPANFPTGCRFHPRCPKAMEICKCIAPQSVDVGNHVVACHLYAEESNNSVE